MKKFLVPFVLGVALTLACLFAPLSHPKVYKLTPERAATHLITYMTTDKETGEETEAGSCTGTAIGPHALLTAVHCDEGTIRTIRLDRPMRDYHIIFGVTDNRDHVIYLLDGPAFTNYVHVQERQITGLGEKVFSYGVGRNDFPPHRYEGQVIVDDNGGDQSDVDAFDGTTIFNLPVVPGDSGSAVYDYHGNIVALVTYRDVHNDGLYAAIGFALNFSPDILERVRNFKETVDNGNNGSDPNTQPPSDAGAGSLNQPAQ